MSTAPFMLLVLITSSGLCFFVNSWLNIWVLLELNTLTFCVLSSTHKKEKNPMEMVMKYFIIQSMASAILLMSSILSKFTKSTAKMILMFSVMSLMIKVAASPFHLWFIDVMNNMKWKMNTLLMTWQKLAPGFLILYQMKIFVLFFIMSSAFTGVFSQINKIKATEIMAFSSVYNLSWLLLAISISTKTFLFYSLLYWATVFMMVQILSASKMKTVSKESLESAKKWFYLLTILHLAGIPPTSGFLAKWLVFSESLKNNYILIPSILLTMSSVNLYIYMRVTNYSVMNNIQNKQKASAKISKILKLTILSLSILPTLIML